uniref:Reverse transcriptase domain-containing protein n=1 Tax=Tanacetum cinerariifolium TaxID=118510 RepID=A0A699IJL5_TANCI|nr:hypothetical protein [Tanacetum cinerariifolium]
MKNSIQASMSNQTNELKNMMASFFQMNTASTLGSGSLPNNTIANLKGELKAITTRSGIVVDGPFIPIPPPFINPEEDERVEETLTDQDLTEYTNKVPPPLVQKSKPPSQRNFVLHINITLADALILIPKYQKMLKALLFNKEKLLERENTPLNENCSAVILKKLPEKLRDHGKFLIPCGFSELKYKALVDLVNQAICTPAGIARDVFVLVGKFTFPADFVIVNYESDPRVPLILGKPFLRIARALIDVHREEMILYDGDERLTLNMRHDTSSYSNQPQKESINLINVLNDLSEDFLENLFPTNHQSGNPTFSPKLTSPKVKDDVFDPEGGNVLPEKLLDLDSTKDEFADELALIIFPPRNDELPFDIESNLKEIEYVLQYDPIKDMDSILEDSVVQSNLADHNDNLVIPCPRFESDIENIYDDPFDSMGEKIKESKLLIDELDLPSDFLPPFEYDSFLSEDFSEVDALPSINNEDKNEKKLAISYASLILEDFDPPFNELPFFKEVPRSKIPLSLSSENEEKVFKPEILISK